jgi:hypothetical protein
MNFKNYLNGTIAICILTLCGCIESNQPQKKSPILNTANSPKTEVVKTPIKTAKTKDEIIDLVKTELKAKKENKPLDILAISGLFNDDELLDYFITSFHITPAEATYSLYSFYDSKTEKLIKLQLGSGPKSINSIEVIKIKPNSFEGIANVKFEANDIGTFERKINVNFTIKDAKLIFDPKSVLALKKADKQISQEVDEAYKALEEDSYSE